MNLDDAGEKIMQAAKVGYEAYCGTARWKSLVTGDPLPQWSELRGVIKNAWFSVASAILFSCWKAH